MLLRNFSKEHKNIFKVFPRKYSTTSDIKINPSLTVDSLQRELRHAKPYENVPGPSRFQMFRGFMKGGDFHGLSFVEVAKLCRQRYGDLFAIPGFFGQKTNVITFTLADYEKIFRTEGVCPTRPGFEVVTAYRASRKGELFDSSGSSESGKEWSKYRHEVNPIFMQPKSVVLYIDPLQDVSESFIESIRETRDPASQEVAATFHKDVMRFALESLGRIIFNKSLGLVTNKSSSLPTSVEGEVLLTSLDAFFKSFYELGIKPSFHNFVKTTAYKNFEKSMATICNISYKLTNESMQEMEKSHHPCGVLKELQKINPKLSPTVAVDSLLGGVEVTTAALISMLLCIATNHKTQEKLREEVLCSIGKKSKFTLENMRNLPYLRACIKESMRMYPLLFSNLRTTSMELSLSGYRIPKGTNVLMPSNMLLNEERYFPQPQQYIPERWLRSNEDALSTRDVIPFIFVPFGFGPRACLGKRLAETILEMTLANIVRHFHVEYNYSTENAFKYNFVLACNIPMNFKFTDIK